MKAVGPAKRLVASLAAVGVLTGTAVGVATPAAAAPTMTAISAVNVRSGPGTTFSILGVLRSGQTVASSGSATATGWTPVTYNGKRAYVSSTYLRVETAAPAATVAPAATDRKVTTTNVNVRSGPGIVYPIVGVAAKGTSLAVSGRVQNGYAEATWSDASRWVYAGFLAESSPTLPVVVGTGVTTSPLTLRGGPSPTSTAYGLLPAKSTVNLTAVITGRYRKIVRGSAVRWILAEHIVPTTIGPVATSTATATAPVAVTLSNVDNFRDAAGDIAGMKRGILWRSAKLVNASSSDQKKLTSLLSGGAIIDLRTSGTATRSPDPTLSGVTELHFPISSNADYPLYVTEAARRASIAKAITAVATGTGAFLIHCTAGKDRTGWTVAMIQYAIGATDAQVRAEYLKSPDIDIADLDAGLAEARAVYGSINAYLTKGLGLSPATLAALKARLKA